MNIWRNILLFFQIKKDYKAIATVGGKFIAASRSIAEPLIYKNKNNDLLYMGFCAGVIDAAAVKAGCTQIESKKFF